MFGMSFGELVVVVVLAIVVIGPKDLPKILRKLGQWSGKLRRMAADLRAQSGIDEVLREGSVAQDIAEIRKLARGELGNVMKGASLASDAPAIGGGEPVAAAALTAGAIASERSYGYEGGHGHGHGERYGLPSDYDEVEATILRDREYPREGADSYSALPDHAITYAETLPASLLASDLLYTTGIADPPSSTHVPASDTAQADGPS